MKGTLFSERDSIFYSRLNKFFPLWFLASILYGISWSKIGGISLSFLAWFAFVPLFICLENKNTFRTFYWRALCFSFLSYLIICHGFLFTARFHPFVFIGAADELFLTSIPFAIIYPIKKRYGFKTALLFFPFMVSLWDWVYQQFEHTTGYLMLSNSQSGYIWLIQFIDIFGIWSVGFWVMLFNVLLFFQYKRFIANPKSMVVKKGFALIILVMIIPSMCYYIYKNFHYKNHPAKRMSITLINSQFSIFDSSPEKWTKNFDRLIILTDSINKKQKQNKIQSNLYVWHEGAIVDGNDDGIIHFIDSAVNDWRTPLLSGMLYIPECKDSSDWRSVNRATLFSTRSKMLNENNCYDKMRLFPVREKIPYHKFLARLPFFHVSLKDPDYYKEGDRVKLIDVDLKDGNIIKIGTPICQEQNYSNIWSDMSLKGAECFIQLSFESWWTFEYFKNQMANITRLRCIETRRYAARCSNGGVTAFIDALGQIYSKSEKPEGGLTENLLIYNERPTFFSRHQNLFPLLCLLIIVTMIIYSEIKRFYPIKKDLSTRF
jgi:apolipoprotein N-acyltransferase